MNDRGDMQTHVINSENLDFSTALLAIKSGHRMRRAGWNGSDQFVFQVPGSTFEVNRFPLLGIFEEGHVVDYQPHIDIKTQQGTVAVWAPSQGDIFAVDWEFAS